MIPSAPSSSCIPKPGPSRLSGGFTILELLIAMTLLSLLVVFASQIVGSVSKGTASSNKRLGADDEARMILDRMQGDFASMVQRTDTDPQFLGIPGNDGFFMISQAPAYSANNSSKDSQMAVIGYMVTNGGLARYSMGYGWDQLPFLTNGAGGGTYYLNNNLTSTNADIIGPSVFRMEMALLIKPGSTNISGGSTNIVGTNVFYQTTTNTLNGIRDVAGVVVALGILDQTSRQIVSAAALTNLVSAFQDCSPPNGIPVSAWISGIPSLSTSGLPAAAKSQIRVYQRYFPLSQ